MHHLYTFFKFFFNIVNNCYLLYSYTKIEIYRIYGFNLIALNLSFIESKHET
jgi:hypothetical protein